MIQEQENPEQFADCRGSSNAQRNSQTKCIPFSAQSQLIKIRRFIKIAIVWLACSEMIPAALIVLFMEGLRHD